MYVIQTRKLLNRCLPDTNTLTAFDDAAAVASDYGVDLPNYAVYSTTQNGNASWFNDFLGDLYNLRAYIFGFGLAVALGCAFLYMHVLRIPFLLFTIIWSSILGLLAIVVVGTILLHELATKWSNDGLHSHAEIQTVRVFEYIGIGVCVLYTCLILVMRERIGLAIGIVKEAAKAMDSMKLIVLVPVLQAAGLVIFMVFWVIYCFFLASSGDLNIHSASYTYDSVEYTYSYRTFEYKPAIRYAFLFMLFAMFWTSEFLLAIGQLVIALSFAAWYFTRDKSTVGSGTVFWVSPLCHCVMSVVCWYLSSAGSAVLLL
jgi:choline transporter-like protein 2/4/5